MFLQIFIFICVMVCGQDVKTMYYSKGVFQYIAKHPVFENGTLCIICLNALWMAIDTDWNPADSILTAKPIFQAADSCFLIYFCFELFVRWMSFRSKLMPFTDGWFCFDSILVVLMLLDTAVMPIITLIARRQQNLGPTAVLRLFRLLRLSRHMLVK